MPVQQFRGGSHCANRQNISFSVNEEMAVLAAMTGMTVRCYDQALLGPVIGDVTLSVGSPRAYRLAANMSLERVILYAFEVRSQRGTK